MKDLLKTIKQLFADGNTIQREYLVTKVEKYSGTNVATLYIEVTASEDIINEVQRTSVAAAYQILADATRCGGDK